MSEFDNDLRPRYSRKKRRTSLRYSVLSLLLAGFNLLMWLLFLLPIYLVRDSSAVDSNGGPIFFLILFIVVNVIGAALASIGLIKSKRNKDVAIFGMIVNVMMIGLNLSLLTPYWTLAGNSEVNERSIQQQITNNEMD